MPSSCWAPLHCTAPAAPERGAIVISILMMKKQEQKVIDLHKGAWAYEETQNQSLGEKAS